MLNEVPHLLWLQNNYIKWFIFSCYNATFYIPEKIFKVTRIRIWTKIKSDRRIRPKNTTDRRICIPLFTPPCKIETSPWALNLIEPVPEAFELPASDWPKIFFPANQRREAVWWLSCFLTRLDRHSCIAHSTRKVSQKFSEQNVRADLSKVS